MGGSTGSGRDSTAATARAPCCYTRCGTACKTLQGGEGAVKGWRKGHVARTREFKEGEAVRDSERGRRNRTRDKEGEQEVEDEG